MTAFALQRPSSREADELDEHFGDDRPYRDDADDGRSHLTTDAKAETTPVIEDGVISDARLRTRRRRAGYVMVASMLAAAAVGVAVFGGQFGGSDEPASSPGHRSAWFAGTSSDATVVAKWSRIHVGWVYVFDDGRAIVHGGGTGIRELRLTPRGLDAFRSGSLDLSRLLRRAAGMTSEPKEYRPPAYALCHVVPSDPLDQLADIGVIRNRLPVPVQSILRGSLTQSFTDDFEADGLDFEHSDPGPGVDCLVLGPGQARAVFSHAQQPAGSPVDDGVLTENDQTYATLTASDGAELNIVAIPILPHGGWVLWGG